MDISAVSTFEQLPTSCLDGVRPITDEEAAFFHENGWVLLRQLVSPQLCEAMLARSKEEMAERLPTYRPQSDNFYAAHEERAKGVVESTNSDTGLVSATRYWLAWRGAIRYAQDSLFSSVGLAKTMGHNVQRLLKRNKPIRVMHDVVACKLPEIAPKTDWHQDSTNLAVDRNVLTVWIALDEIKPEQGPVRFLSGSHRAGMLGQFPDDVKHDLLDEYPELGRFYLSPANHLKPGDCTVHHGLTVHGASANRGDAPRWSYFICYFTADSLYSGAPCMDTDGLDLSVGRPLDHPSFRQCKN